MLFKNFRKDNQPKPKTGPRPRGSNLGPSIITADVVIDGNLISGGELQIDGTVNGDVRARAAVVDVHGIVHGEVAAEDIIVRGRVIGPIRGVRVNLHAGSHVEGDVVSESISVENGCHIEGKIRHSEDPLNEPSPGYNAAHEPADYDPNQQHGLGIYDEDGYRDVAPRKPNDAAE